VRLAAGSVAPTPVLLGETSRWLEGRRVTPELAAEAGRRAMDEIQPIDDVRSAADYRKQVTGQLVRRFLVDQYSSP
jgi:CO/xanthine dehydrogenase FAD-binding subunit